MSLWFIFAFIRLFHISLLLFLSLFSFWHPTICLLITSHRPEKARFMLEVPYLKDPVLWNVFLNIVLIHLCGSDNKTECPKPGLGPAWTQVLVCLSPLGFSLTFCTTCEPIRSPVAPELLTGLCLELSPRGHPSEWTAPVGQCTICFMGSCHISCPNGASIILSGSASHWASCTFRTLSYQGSTACVCA